MNPYELRFRGALENLRQCHDALINEEIPANKKEQWARYRLVKLCRIVADRYEKMVEKDFKLEDFIDG